MESPSQESSLIVKRFASVTPPLTTELVLFAFIKEVLVIGLVDRVPRRTCSYVRSLNWVTSASAAISDGQHSGVQCRRRRQSRDIEDFLLVERLARYQGMRRARPVACGALSVALGLFVALADDSGTSASMDSAVSSLNGLRAAVSRLGRQGRGSPAARAVPTRAVRSCPSA